MRIWRRIAADYWLATGLLTLGRTQSELGDVAGARQSLEQAQHIQSKFDASALEQAHRRRRALTIN